MPSLPFGFAPFDPDALVAMLKAFYPVVSGAAFAQARSERPSYFGGGVIFGSKGDKLRLPDGREYDCIIGAGGPASLRQWWCALIDPSDTGGDDPFALDDGPLVPIDEDMPIFPGGEPGFEVLVVDAIRDFDGADDRLDRAAGDVVEFTGADELENSYADLVEPAAENHDRIREALDSDDPIDVIDATNNHDSEIDAAREDYVEQAPPDIAETDPGAPPRDDGPPGPPPA
jgi:hypothetical protein